MYEFEKKVIWTRETTLQLIELWKQHPLLYDPQHIMYHNRRARYRAFTELVKAMAPTIRGVTQEDIKIKLTNLRSQYNHELVKIKKNQTNGTGVDEAMHSTYWFNKMNFLKKFIKPRNGRSIFEKETENTVIEDDSNIMCSDFDSSDIPTQRLSPALKILKTETIEANTPPPVSKTSLSTLSNEDPILKETFDVIKALSENMKENGKPPNHFSNDIETFGEYIKAELSLIQNEDIRDDAKQEIINIVYKFKKTARTFNS